MTNHHYDNSERLEGVSEQDWREALDELTAYLTWRLRGKTAKGAHSEKVLGMPAFDYYQEVISWFPAKSHIRPSAVLSPSGALESKGETYIIRDGYSLLLLVNNCR